MTVAAPRTAHVYAYEALRSRILNGDLAPGTALLQASLARELGVSMTPVREALRDLATEGLVSMSPHRGATVTTLDLNDAQEIYRIRLQLEPNATSMAVLEASVELLNQADQLIARMAETSGADWIALNLEFHRLLLSPARSPRLLSILSSLQEAATLYVGVAMAHRRAASPETEHQAILAAYRRRDPTAAASAVAEHILSSLKSLEPEAGPA